MSKKYIVLTGSNLGELERWMNEGAAVGYRAVGGVTPVYSPALFSLKLHGYVALMEQSASTGKATG